MAEDFGREDQAGYEGYGERDAAVKAPCLRVRPEVHGAYDLPSLVGVRTLGLGGAVVADLGPAAVADHPSLVVHLATHKDLILGADPGVVRGVVGEPGGAVALRTDVRVAREAVEAAGDAEQEDGVARREEDLGVDAHPPTVPSARPSQA